MRRSIHDSAQTVNQVGNAFTVNGLQSVNRDRTRDFILNNQLITLIGIVMLGAAVPAFAGPDWQTIDQSRLIKKAQNAAAARATGASPASTNLKAGAPGGDEKAKQKADEVSDLVKSPK